LSRVSEADDIFAGTDELTAIDPSTGIVFTRDPQAWLSLCAPPELDNEVDDPTNPQWSERWTLTPAARIATLVESSIVVEVPHVA